MSVCLCVTKGVSGGCRGGPAWAEADAPLFFPWASSGLPTLDHLLCWSLAESQSPSETLQRRSLAAQW